MIGNLYKKIASYFCCCFKTSILDSHDNDDYNVFNNDVTVTDDKLHRSPTSFDTKYSLSNEAFNYSDIYR